MFVATAGYALYALVHINLMVLDAGQLKEGMMVFVIFPIGFVKYGILGGLVGFLAHYIYNRFFTI